MVFKWWAPILLKICRGNSKEEASMGEEAKIPVVSEQKTHVWRLGRAHAS